MQINGENVLGVSHEKAVSLLRSRADITIVVQRDVASPSTSLDQSSLSTSSPRRVTLEKPQSPMRPDVNTASTGSIKHL